VSSELWVRLAQPSAPSQLVLAARPLGLSTHWFQNQRLALIDKSPIQKPAPEVPGVEEKIHAVHNVLLTLLHGLKSSPIFLPRAERRG